MTSFTELKFSPSALKALTAQKQAALKTNRGLSDLLGFGLGVVSRRLDKDPLRYLDYGPWWWALKGLLNAKGYSYGDDFDSVVAAEYCGRTDAETMVAADQFRAEWLQSAQVGTNSFRLGAEGDDYILRDADMESRPPA